MARPAGGARSAEARIEVARRCGMRPLVERLQYAWTPAHGLPVRPGRLHLRPEPDDAVMDRSQRAARRDMSRVGTSALPWPAFHEQTCGRRLPEARATVWPS